MTLFGWLTGTAALTLCVGSYLMRSHKGLTLTAALGVLMWAAHFASQGVWTASALSVLMAIRMAAAIYVVNFRLRARWKLTCVAWALTWLCAYVTWQGWVSLPSSLATTFLAYAGFHLHYTELRKALLFGEVLWFINGVAANSPLAMSAAVISFGINLRMLVVEQRASRVALLEPLEPPKH